MRSNLIFGYNISTDSAQSNQSIRKLVQDILLSKENDLQTFDHNKDLRYISSTDEDDFSFEKIKGIKNIFEDIFSVEFNCDYYFNPSIIDKFFRDEYDVHLNRFRRSFLLHYFNYLNTRNDLSDFENISFNQSLDKFLLSWLYTEYTDMERLRIINFLEKFPDSSQRLIDLAKGINLPSSKKNLFGQLSECFLIVSLSDFIDEEARDRLKNFSHLCIEIQKQKSSQDTYRFCREISTAVVKEDSQIRSLDLSKFVAFKGELNNSLHAMRTIALHSTPKELSALPLESITSDHAYNLLDGILLKHGSSFFEAFWCKSLDPSEIPEEFIEFICQMEDRLMEPPWQLLFFSRLVMKGMSLPGKALELPIYQKLLLSYGLDNLGCRDDSEKLLNTIKKDQVKTHIEALLLVTLFDDNPLEFVRGLGETFDFVGLLKKDRNNFHPHLYPLLHKYCTDAEHQTKELCNRFSDGLSPFSGIY